MPPTSSRGRGAPGAIGIVAIGTGLVAAGDFGHDLGHGLTVHISGSQEAIEDDPGYGRHAPSRWLHPRGPRLGAEGG